MRSSLIRSTPHDVVCRRSFGWLIQTSDFFCNQSCTELLPRSWRGFNSFVGARREEQQRHRVEDLCDLIIYSHEVGVAKPDRRIFELTWQRLGVQPEEMLFLDNAQVHVQAARACGIQAILFEDTAQALAALESRLQASPR
jgi:haloacid dehalogenase-like hydrolase